MLFKTQPPLIPNPITLPPFLESVPYPSHPKPNNNPTPTGPKPGSITPLGTPQPKNLRIQNSTRDRHPEERGRGKGARRKASRGSLPGDLEESGPRLLGNPREHYRIGTRGRVEVTRAHEGKQRRKGSYEFVSDFGYHVRRRLADISFGLPVCTRANPGTPSRTQTASQVFKNAPVLDRSCRKCIPRRDFVFPAVSTKSASRNVNSVARLST